MKIGKFYLTKSGIVKTLMTTWDAGVIYFNQEGTGRTRDTSSWQYLEIDQFPRAWNPCLPDDYVDKSGCDPGTLKDLYMTLIEDYCEEVLGEDYYPGIELPDVGTLIAAHDNMDVTEAIESTTLYGLPLELIMTKFELVLKHGLKSVDYALPQAWLDEQKAKHGESPQPYFVWCYDDEPTFGRPYCLVEGKEHLAD